MKLGTKDVIYFKAQMFWGLPTCNFTSNVGAGEKQNPSILQAVIFMCSTNQSSQSDTEKALLVIATSHKHGVPDLPVMV